MGSLFSLKLLLHTAGFLAVSQLIFQGEYLDSVYSKLSGNDTDFPRQSFAVAVNRLTDAFFLVTSFIVGTKLVMLMYLAAGLYVAYLIRKFYNFLFGDIELYCPVEKTGFDFPADKISQGLVTKQEYINEVRRRKQNGAVPPPYPNGWFALLRSRELQAGTSTSVNALGQNFAIFRDKEGEVYILDAYCPHLGANLGVAGKVIGNCIECPFHGWQFSGETGECSKIPYSSGKIPAQAKVKVWPSLEVNGSILVWHDAEGRDPFWFPEEISIIKSRGMKYCGCSTHFVNSHIEDIPENGADVSHLNCLHSAGVASGSGLDFRDLISGKLHAHQWTARWEALPEPTSHIGQMTLHMSNFIFGIKVHSLSASSIARQTGPGLVCITMNFSFGVMIIIQTVTPQEAFLQKKTVIVYSDFWIPTFIVKYFIHAYNIQLERDMIVWNNKRYNMKPLLVREDELIRKHRRWYSQFYSENSRKFSFLKDDLTF